MSKASGCFVKRSVDTFVSVDDKVFILDPEKDDYYELNESAAFIWKQIGKKGKSIDDLASDLSVEYNIGSDRAKRDTKDLLNILSKRSVVKLA